MKNKKLNILFLCSWYPNPESKSNGIFIQRHAQALATKHYVTVLFAKSINGLSQPVFQKKQDNQLIEYMFFYPKIKQIIPVLSSITKLIRFRSAYKKLINQLPANQSFDIIHVNTIFPAAIPALTIFKKYPQAKLIITEHWSGYYPEDNNYKGFLLNYFTKKLVSKAKAICVISNKLKLAMQAHQLNGQYELINNVVDTSIFKPTFFDSKEIAHTLRILHVSSLVNREKNIFGIIDTAEQLAKKSSDFHLTIIGDENTIEFSEYQKIIRQKKLANNITFTGYKSPIEIADYMNQADLFLLFSYFEGMPVVILESLACGLPVITTPVGEVNTMVKSNMGIILTSHSVNECVEKIMTFKRKNFTSKLEMHEHIARNYGIESVCSSITNLYHKYS